MARHRVTFNPTMPLQPLASSRLAIAFPAAGGGAIVLPMQEATHWGELSAEEQSAMLELAQQTVERLSQAATTPTTFTVGFDTDTSPPSLRIIPRPVGVSGLSRLLPGPPGLTTGPDNPLRGVIRPLLREADRIDIVAAFIQDSGLKLLQAALLEAMRRGAAVRLITGDYLNITQSRALRRLLDWQDRVAAFSAEGEQDAGIAGSLAVRVVETGKTGRAFHPKCWRVEGEGLAAAWVGSSNVSWSALVAGEEWNLRVDASRQPQRYSEVDAAIEDLWERTRPIDAEWVAAYELRVAEAEQPLPPGEVLADEDDTVTPTPIQSEALAALARCRTEGRGRALVVMATGLGKTFLAAFDVLAWATAAGRQPRVLFLAHRRELLTQAAATFRRLLPTAPFGWFVGTQAEVSAQITFASVQKLSRPEHLAKFAGDHFDYIIVDEVHHAGAASYRRLLGRFAPGFLLGLTATPDRADDIDVISLFDDCMPYRADLGEGIRRGLLVPFAYTGLADTIDYAPLPWRSGRFDPEALDAAVASQVRMETLWAAWQAHPGARSIVFCASIRHAGFVRDWLAARGVRVVALHSGSDSAPREESLEALSDGTLDAVCAVDLLNEGIDLPGVDRVVMLRPTESPVVFLQQLGRGLRTSVGKSLLRVIDFVGNHRVFLGRIRTLLALSGVRPDLSGFLAGDVSAALPDGCSVDIDPAARDVLRSLLPASDRSETVRLYRELRTARGRRPRAGELLRLGLDPGTLKERSGGWLQFVASEGDLSEDERRALRVAGDWLSAVETTRLSKSFKLVMLDVLLKSEALSTGMRLDDLAARCHDAYLRSPALFRDLTDVQRLSNPRRPAPGQWLSYWKEKSLKDWTGIGGRSWFTIAEGQLLSRLPVPVEQPRVAEAVARLTAELVDWRLTAYRRASTLEGRQSTFVAHILQDGAAFRLKMPPNHRLKGELIARLPDGTPWRFIFDGDGVAARPLFSGDNALPALVSGWFGPTAGASWLLHRLRFTSTPDGWWVRPLGGLVPPLTARREIRALPLADIPTDAIRYGLDSETVHLPAPDIPGLIAARALNDDLDGGDTPIRRGDWLLLRPDRHRRLSGLHNRIALLTDATEAPLLRRVMRTGRRFILHAENQPPLPVPSRTAAHALLAGSVSPEQLAPAEGTVIPAKGLAAAMGLSEIPEAPGGRVDGHLVLLITERGQLVAPDRIRLPGMLAEPGETAFVLTRTGKDWRYAGVAHPVDDTWAVAGVDFETWRKLGGRAAPQRTLDGRWKREARRVLAGVEAVGGVKVEGVTRRGVRLVGGMLVTVEDVGWVLAGGGRYLVGTPGGRMREAEMVVAAEMVGEVDG
ncbi:MAG: superfamily II DNA or RNA helicase/HKD family nuclease [Myxococcota bacterium]|jgi:superfamily II DNA or RNA helicase/HKD family nuclease